MKIALIGVGNLGLAIAQGIVDQNEFEVEQLVLTKRNVSNLDSWKKHNHVMVTPKNVDAVRASDIIILCIQPGQLNGVLEEIKPVLEENRHVLISTITGKSTKDIEAIVGEVPIIRAMPNTAISVGQSMTCLCNNAEGKPNLPLAEKIFASVGDTMVIHEDMMQAATVVCASGVAFWLRLIRATTQGAVQLGFDAPEAKHMATQACLGAASLLLATGNHPEEEIDRVTTPQGCTIEGLNEMEHEGLSSALIKGLKKSFDKISNIASDK
ncbi:pyrroline-5-carboxylate reductase [Reichenbachiella versicolor]|uniref:pyrroline-5-carboxylate reductase n=1 Tax=Reichenbachiella versicolor TaxID=1821036 RepID=UPI000D6E749C|nr:pyrroline-5-carboxylate reductase [Reichenbachiella versicolor]